MEYNSCVIGAQGGGVEEGSLEIRRERISSSSLFIVSISLALGVVNERMTNSPNRTNTSKAWFVICFVACFDDDL